MSGLRMGMDLLDAAGPQAGPGPAHDPVDGDPATADRRPPSKIEKELQENPFLEAEGEARRAGRSADAEFDPDSTPLKHDETGELEFSRLDALNRDWDDHFNEEHRVSRAAMDEEGDRKLDAMANMPRRGRSRCRTTSPNRLGEMELDDAQRKLARHICTFIDRTGYLGTRSTKTGQRGRTTSRRSFRADHARRDRRALRRAGDGRGGRGHARPRRAEARPAGRRRPRPEASACCSRSTPDTPLRDVAAGARSATTWRTSPTTACRSSRRRPGSTSRRSRTRSRRSTTSTRSRGSKFAETGTQYVMPGRDRRADRRRRVHVRLTDDWVPNDPHQQARTSISCKRQGPRREGEGRPCARSSSRPTGW